MARCLPLAKPCRIFRPRIVASGLGADGVIGIDAFLLALCFIFTGDLPESVAPLVERLHSSLQTMSSSIVESHSIVAPVFQTIRPSLLPSPTPPVPFSY